MMCVQTNASMGFYFRAAVSIGLVPNNKKGMLENNKVEEIKQKNKREIVQLKYIRVGRPGLGPKLHCSHWASVRVHHPSSSIAGNVPFLINDGCSTAKVAFGLRLEGITHSPWLIFLHRPNTTAMHLVEPRPC